MRGCDFWTYCGLSLRLFHPSYPVSSVSLIIGSLQWLWALFLGIRFYCLSTSVQTNGFEDDREWAQGQSGHGCQCQLRYFMVLDQKTSLELHLHGYDLGYNFFETLTRTQLDNLHSVCMSPQPWMVTRSSMLPTL